MKMISHSRVVECERFCREFRWERDPNSGFSFECNKSGTLLNDNEEAQKNYRRCTDGSFKVKDLGIVRHTWTYIEPAVGRCACGCEVVLDRFTNTCDGCNRDYNKSGQELSPREFWGEETGECVEDILAIR
jgi:hypothetical protein